MIRIVADDKIPFLKGALEPWAKMTYMDGKAMDNRAVKEADALLIRTRTLCNRSLLNDSKVRFIATATIGFDHIDTAYCESQDIRWVNAPGCNAGSVMQYIASVLARIAMDNHFSLAGKTIGIIGVGNVGKKIEQLARIFGMRTLLNDPPRERVEGSGQFVPLDTLLNESDIISLHVPLNRNGKDKTLGLINQESLGKIKRTAWLINTSRGEVVDEDALRAAINGKRIGGTVLDVWENEPAINQVFRKMINVATPHIAGYSVDGKRNGTVRIVRSLASYFNLPAESWEPTDLPLPENPEIIPEAGLQTTEELIFKTILHTYDVEDDHLRLFRAPQDFEKQRAFYPVRREFPAYTVRTQKTPPDLVTKLTALGFQIA